MDRGEDRAEEGEVRAPIMFEERSQGRYAFAGEGRYLPGGSAAGGDKLYIISGHVKSDPMGVFRLVQRVSRKLSVSLQIS